MTRLHATYALVRQAPGLAVICDTGKSVTDDARAVIAQLTSDGLLSPGIRLLYHDLVDVATDELMHDGCGRFLGIRPRRGGRQRSK